MGNKINIRESLLNLDKNTDFKYNLTTLYESLSDYETKKGVAHKLSHKKDALDIYNYLNEAIGHMQDEHTFAPLSTATALEVGQKVYKPNSDEIWTVISVEPKNWIVDIVFEDENGNEIHRSAGMNSLWELVGEHDTAFEVDDDIDIEWHPISDYFDEDLDNEKAFYAVKVTDLDTNKEYYEGVYDYKRDAEYQSALSHQSDPMYDYGNFKYEVIPVTEHTPEMDRLERELTRLKLANKRKSQIESIKEDTVKTKSGKWVNKGKEGTHGTFKTKKEADAQRKAMFAQGFKESVVDWKKARYFIDDNMEDDYDRAWEFLNKRATYVTSVDDIPDEVEGQKIRYRFSTGKNYNIDLYYDSYREHIFVKLPEDLDEKFKESTNIKEGLSPATPYMLRNDGTLLECEDIHPYIKFGYLDAKEAIGFLLGHKDMVEWFYKNTNNETTREMIRTIVASVEGFDKSKFDINEDTYIAKSDEEIQEFIDSANDETNQEFLRIRMSAPLYGGNSDSLYARVSSVHFDWYPLLWDVVNDNKNITDVTVIKDANTLGGRYAPYVVDGQPIEEMPREDFLCLSSGACLEMYKSKLDVINAANEKLIEGKTLREAYKGCRPRYARGFMQKDIQEGAVDFDLENIFASSKSMTKEDN